MDDQMRMLIQERNFREEKLKKKLHSLQLQLNHTIHHKKIMQDSVNTLQQDFKQKEMKLLNDFSQLKTLKNKLKNKLYIQHQSIQTVHMMLKPNTMCDEDREKDIVDPNPFHLKKAKMVQPTLYDGDEIFKPHHIPVTIHDSEETLEMAETTRQKMSEKMNNPKSVAKRVKIIPPNYSKGVQKTLVTKVKDMKEIFKSMEAEVDQNAIDLRSGEIERKNLLITNENLIAKCIAQDVFYTVTNSALTASQFHELSIAYNVAKTRAIKLEAEILNLHKNIQNDDHDNMVKHLSRLDVDNLNLQLKYQHLKDRTKTSKSRTSKDAPEFDAFFELNEKDAQLQTHRNTIRKLKAQISQLKANKSDVTGTLLPQPLESQNFQLHDNFNKLQKENDCFQAENSKIKHHYKELYDSIKITCATHIEKITSLLNEIETLKRTSDNSLKYACVYTKTSQELLENMIASCPKTVNKRDRYNASTHTKRNKHVTFAEPLETSPNNTSTQVKHLNEPKTNVLAISSTGGNSVTKASRSQPRSNTKIDRSLTAKSRHKKNVEAHLRNNKSDLHKKNRVDSGISFKRAVVNLNSNSHFKTCNKCMISFNHDECVAKFLKSSNKSQSRKFRESNRVYYVEGLGHNLFSVGQFCDSDLEVAFRKHTCFVRDLYGVDLSKGTRGTNLYTISIEYMMQSSPICLLSKASKNKSWLWHRRLNHLNFGTINDLARKDLSINGKKYILVIVDDYSSEDLRKLQAKVDIGFFVGYAPDRKGYRIYKKQTQQFMETIHITFDELTGQTAPDHISLRPTPKLLTHGYIISELVQNSVSLTPYVPPSKKDYEIMFQQLFDEYFNPPPRAVSLVSVVVAALRAVDLAGSPSSTTIDQDVPSASTSPTTQEIQS
uniref:Integrase, catalytic region, zinc finger, CCHC-type, peptidase aspartic, catalytic n=1 Tax=Tanacetum cinerariifolium TaxID=118510 RepID=A0A6L2L7L5_TANCI|nr:integrase, catalytic region, zinc finger, CCHC-type, peptidase aspartic, catalytic [Tanacetum cinerariifolium]